MENESEYSMPSRTDDSDEVSFPGSNSKLQKERLSSGENEYLRKLEEKNRILTVILGDKIMEAEMAKENLKEHRETLRNAYVSLLRVHDVAEGKIDTKLGEITVLSRSSKE